MVVRALARSVQASEMRVGFYFPLVKVGLHCK